MSSGPDDFPGRSSGSGRRPAGGAQGASRGGVRPDADDSQVPGASDDFADAGSRSAGDAPFGGYPFDDDRSGSRAGSAGGKSGTFLGLPVTLIYAIGAAIIGIVLIGAVCGRPTATANGTVAGQVKSLNADRSVSTLPGAQVVVRGSSQTYTATSTDVPASAEGEAAYNYRIENVPPGTYTMAVTPPAGSNLQPEQDITFEVEPGQLFPQSVMLLAQGVQKPRALTQSELQPGESGGYVNERGERVVYQQGSGFDTTDALLLYLLWRNPGGYGYGYPPVIVNSPSTGTSGSNYRVTDPPTRTSSGQTVTERKATTPGQGAARPSSAGGATGSGPTYSSGPSNTGSSSGTSSGSSGSTTSSGSGGSSSTTTQTKPSTSSGSGSSVSAPSVPSQGASRPSSSSSSPSRSSAPSRSSGSSGGGRR